MSEQAHLFKAFRAAGRTLLIGRGTLSLAQQAWRTRTAFAARLKPPKSVTLCLGRRLLRQRAGTG
ncbi:hypothetical protein [Desulfopila sp. IMCC35006]|uniref:hypothetical protein n=1 Tax=Desulfopila sp. IMCC35006 TaxID=2569542 RepID=UPI0010AC8FAA|nr:hypothetical protein [Desulfopila sp. IMCC35006]